MMTPQAKATFRSAVLILLAISLVILVYWLLVHVDLEQWELLAVATAAGSADVLKAAILRPADTSKPAFVPEDRVLAVKQSANLTHCRGTPGRFSQFGEDEYAWRHFFYGRRGGSFLELGGYNGCAFSNTLLLEAGAGWRGVLVEASPSHFKGMAAARPAATCIHAAVCNATSVVHYADAGAVGGIVEFMGQEFRHRWNISAHGHPAVQCFPLRDVLAHLGVRHLDFLSLDVEGGELSVLQTLDFAQVVVDVLLVETVNAATFEGIVILLGRQGFALAERQEWNSWFVRNGFRPSAAPGIGRGDTKSA